MSDDAMIRRGDVLAQVDYTSNSDDMCYGPFLRDRIAAIPAVTPAPALDVVGLVDRIRKAWPIVRDADCSGGTLCAAIDEIDAALAAMEGK